MGLFGSGGSKSGSAQKWATPYAKSAASSAQDVFNQNQGSLESLTNTVTGTVPGLSSQFSGLNPLVQQAQGYFGDVIGGKYLDASNNPGLAGVIDRTARDVKGTTNSNFSLAGRYGSGAHTDILSRNLADAENNILYQNYAQERGLQQQAAAAPGEMQESTLAQLLQAAGVGAELPYTGTNALANQLSGLFSGGTQKGPGLGTVVAGGLASGVGSALGAKASDRRLKTNIERVGELEDGLGVFEWDYIDPARFGEGRHRGVMADEVEALRPWALGPLIDGEFASVNYAAL